MSERLLEIAKQLRALAQRTRDVRAIGPLHQYAGELEGIAAPPPPVWTRPANPLALAAISFPPPEDHD